MFTLLWKTIYFIFPCINKNRHTDYILDDEIIFEDQDNDFDISKLKIIIPK